MRGHTNDRPTARGSPDARPVASMPLAGAAAPARQDEQLQIAFSVPGLNFPFFVHMMNIARDKAAELDVELIELDGQDDSATQSPGSRR